MLLGAAGGIGSAVTEAMLNIGFRVVAADIIKPDIIADQSALLWLEVDASVEEDVAQAVAATDQNVLENRL